MPTYEFRCPEGHDFEKFFRSIGAAPSEMPCPTCGLTAERRVSAGAGLVFKGSGFYITDYGKDGKKPQGTGPGTPAKDAPATGSASQANAASETPASKPDSSGAATGPATGGTKSSSTAKPDTKPASSKPKSDE